MICEFEFQFLNNPIWVKADVGTTEILTAMRTGKLRGMPIAAVRLFSVDTEEQCDTFVYSFQSSSAESSWSMETIVKTADSSEED